MTCHFVLIEKFNSMIEGHGGPDLTKHPNPVHELNESERAMVFNIFLHSADISNPCKPWETQKKW